MKERKYNFLTHKVHKDRKIDLTLEPIYKNFDNYGMGGTTDNMEIGEGYWVCAQKNEMSIHRYFTLYHRHMNGKSVSRTPNSQCATCREWIPTWVKGAMNLIIWSMNEHDATAPE